MAKRNKGDGPDEKDPKEDAQATAEREAEERAQEDAARSQEEQGRARAEVEDSPPASEPGSVPVPESVATGRDNPRGPEVVRMTPQASPSPEAGQSPAPEVFAPQGGAQAPEDPFSDLHEIERAQLMSYANFLRRQRTGDYSPVGIDPFEGAQAEARARSQTAGPPRMSSQELEAARRADGPPPPPGEQVRRVPPGETDPEPARAGP
jgi:hypothetical protein